MVDVVSTVLHGPLVESIPEPLLGLIERLLYVDATRSTPCNLHVLVFICLLHRRACLADASLGIKVWALMWKRPLASEILILLRY